MLYTISDFALFTAMFATFELYFLVFCQLSANTNVAPVKALLKKSHNMYIRLALFTQIIKGRKIIMVTGTEREI